MTTPRGVTRRTALGLAVTGALTGCGLNPDSTIRSGLDVNPPAPEAPDFIPSGPQSGQGPEAIIEGFLRAGATSGSGLDTARDFLTTTCAEGWYPDLNQTIVHPTVAEPFELEKTGTGRYTVRSRVVARIDQDARYLVAEPNDGAAFEFRLTRVDGEWRIDGLQTDFGRLLSTTATDRLYTPYDVHYPAVGRNVLVPDERWIVAEQEATRLVRSQLGQVPDYLEDAVSSDFGATLATTLPRLNGSDGDPTGSVPINDGVAQVDLEAGSVDTDAMTRTRLAAQLVATLLQLPDVTEVAITLDGSPMSIPGVDGALISPGQFDFADQPGTRDPDVLVRVGTGLVPVSDSLLTLGGADLWTGRYRFEVDEEWARLGLRRDGKELAGVADDGDELVRWPHRGEAIRVPTFASGLTRPCYDIGTVLWVAGTGVGEESGHRLFHINTRADTDDAAKSAPQYVPSPWLGSRHVVAAVVSPDGSRIAVISEEEPGTGSELWVSGIVRESNELPRSTSPAAVRAGANLVEMVDAVWVDSTTVAVCGRRDKEPAMHPFLVGVNGEVVELNWPPTDSSRQAWRSAAREVTTNGGSADMVVTSEDDRVWQRVAGSWREIDHVDGVVVAGT